MKVVKKKAARWASELDAARLQAGSSLSPASGNLPLVDGEVDLRGLTLSSDIRTLARVTFDHVNLASAKMRDLWVEECRFSTTNFADADLSGWADHGNTFTECVFDGTSLAKASVGHRGSRYTRCLFRRVNFLGATFARAEFDECEFSDCKLKDVDFFGSSFERCTFKGRLEDVWFRGGYPPPVETFKEQFGKARPNTMSMVDFSSAELVGVTFSNNCDLSSCRLPNDERVARFAKWPATTSIADDLVTEFFSSDQLDVARNLLRAYGSDQTQTWYIVNFGDVADAAGGNEDFAQRFRWLLMKANEAAAGWS